MNITIDRESGVFDKTTSDQLNIKATQVYDQLQAIPYNVKPYKEPTYSDFFNGETEAKFIKSYAWSTTVGNNTYYYYATYEHVYDFASDVTVNSYSINSLHIVSLSIRPKFVRSTRISGNGTPPGLTPTMIVNELTKIGESSQLPLQDVFVFDGVTIANISNVDASIKIQNISAPTEVTIYAYFIR